MKNKNIIALRSSLKKAGVFRRFDENIYRIKAATRLEKDPVTGKVVKKPVSPFVFFNEIEDTEYEAVEAFNEYNGRRRKNFAGPGENDATYEAIFYRNALTWITQMQKMQHNYYFMFHNPKRYYDTEDSPWSFELDDIYKILKDMGNVRDTEERNGNKERVHIMDLFLKYGNALRRFRENMIELVKYTGPSGDLNKIAPALNRDFSKYEGDQFGKK